jgi:hypothetical protein
MKFAMGALLATMRLSVNTVSVHGVTGGLACCVEGRKEFSCIFVPFFCRFIIVLEVEGVGNRFRYGNRERGVLRTLLLSGHRLFVGYLFWP